WDPVNFQMHRIKNGLGLSALPISFGLRRNIPPRTKEDLQKTQAQLDWILDINSDYDNQLVAIYADDMEKVAAVGWDARGPLQFQATLKWLSADPSLQPVTLAAWAATHRAATASHSRIGVIIAETAHWMTNKCDLAHADLRDLDSDGQDELVLKNDNLFAVFSPKNGGRLVYMFTVNNPPGRLVIGNPIDDWNLLEDLHAYMDTPPNHPGALADVGYEHDNYSTEIRVPYGDTVWARLSNSEK